MWASRLICFINSWVLWRFRRAASARRKGFFFKSKWMKDQCFQLVSRHVVFFLNWSTIVILLTSQVKGETNWIVYSPSNKVSIVPSVNASRLINFWSLIASFLPLSSFNNSSWKEIRRKQKRRIFFSVLTIRSKAKTRFSQLSVKTIRKQKHSLRFYLKRDHRFFLIDFDRIESNRF